MEERIGVEDGHGLRYECEVRRERNNNQ
jgi:hypothetical protein